MHRHERQVGLDFLVFWAPQIFTNLPHLFSEQGPPIGQCPSLAAWKNCQDRTPLSSLSLTHLINTQFTTRTLHHIQHLLAFSVAYHLIALYSSYSQFVFTCGGKPTCRWPGRRDWMARSTPAYVDKMMKLSPSESRTSTLRNTSKG